MGLRIALEISEWFCCTTFWITLKERVCCLTHRQLLFVTSEAASSSCQAFFNLRRKCRSFQERVNEKMEIEHYHTFLSTVKKLKSCQLPFGDPFSRKEIQRLLRKEIRRLLLTRRGCVHISGAPTRETCMTSKSEAAKPYKR